jgi:hypothetical protein
MLTKKALKKHTIFTTFEGVTKRRKQRYIKQ